MACETVRTPNIVEMLIEREHMFEPTAGLIEAVLSTEDIDLRIRQMMILRAAKVFGAPYEAGLDRPMLRGIALTLGEVEAAAADGPVRGVAPDYILVCTAVDELSEIGTLSDDTLRAMLDRFGEATIRKFILVIGCFNLLSHFLCGCRVPWKRKAEADRNEGHFAPWDPRQSP